MTWTNRLAKFRKLPHSSFEVTITWLAVGRVKSATIRTGRGGRTQPKIFSADEGADIRVSEGKAVAWPHSVPFKFNGKISKVTTELKPTAAAIATEADNPVVKSL